MGLGGCAWVDVSSAFPPPLTLANKMVSSTSPAKPTKQRNSSLSTVEKEFLILCRDMTIPKQLNKYMTAASVTVGSFGTGTLISYPDLPRSYGRKIW